MATGSVLSPSAGLKHQATTFETQSMLEKCWRVDVNWSYYPDVIHQVSAKLLLDSDPASASTSTEWVEPVLLWVSIGMPTGSGKSPLFKYLLTLLRKERVRCGLDETSPALQLEEATFEKMGAMMAKNHSKLLGLYDELSTFLTRINLFKSRGISDSHDLALFLQLYNGHPWARRTGLCSGVFAFACVVYMHVVCVFVCMSCVPYIATLVLCVQVSLCVT